MSKIEWLKWVIFEHPGPLKSRAKQLGLFFTFEVYSLCSRLRAYPVSDFLENKSLRAGQYVLARQQLPFSIRLLDKIFPFGKWEHVEHVPYPLKVAEEMRKSSKRLEMIEVSYELKAGSW